MKRISYKNNPVTKKEISLKPPFYVVVLFVIFIIATVYTTIKTSSLGTTLVDLESKEKELISENANLADSLVHLSSMTSIEKKAEDLGFVKPQNVIYLGKQESVAQLR